ncbi:efflux RND transporter permease subunit [Abyssibius alkaniclasticus]|uniref:efflux RND transporter permease subunit n=1 Tax=Abyssibius alkaniclasticus TaxID=2881234 RepID=UPI004058070E
MIDFIERILRMPRVVVTLMLILLLGGFTSYQSLPKESFPSIDIPFFYISVSQSGISPSDAERLLAKPIEDRLTGLDGLENITTTATTGHASIFLEFNVNADKDQALSDIRAKMDGVSNELPADAEEPSVSEISFDDQPVLSVSIYGDVPERTLVREARALRDVLEGLPNVQSVSLSGAREEVLEVQIDQLRLEAYGLTAGQIFDALARNNTMVAGGTLDNGLGSFNIEIPGLISTAEEVYNLPLLTVGDRVVVFGDVATVTRTFKDATEYAYVNGSPAITLGVVKKLGTNIMEVSDEIRAAVAVATADWPAEIGHSFLLDQSISTKNLYRSLEAAVMTAVVLVLIMCIATLGVRPAIMIGMSIPISFMIAFLVLNWMGYTINMMVMFGLVIAVGVLVDDPIVVVEYAERKLSEGVSRKRAFILAARKMFVPVVSATATTLGAFVPLLFWPGIIGKFMSYLPIVVIIVMVASLVSALIFMPVIGAMIAKNEMSEKEKEKADIVMYPDKFDPKKVTGLTGVYVRIMARLLHAPGLTLTAGFAIVIGIFMYFAANPTGIEAFPKMEPEYGTVSVITRGNYAPNEIRDFLIEVQDEVLQVPGIQDVILTFAGNNGPSLGAGATPPDTIGTLQLQLQPWQSRYTAEEIFAEIRARTADISGLEIQIAAEEGGPPAGKDINLRVESTNYDDLAPAVAALRAYIETEIPGALDVEDGRPAPGIDWRLTFDRAEASKFGIGLRDLGPYIQLVTTGVTIGNYLPDDSIDELDIVVRLPPDERSLDALDNIRISTVNGLVPVSNFLERRVEPATGSITRQNGLYSMNVAANLPPDMAAAEQIALIKVWEAAQDWPENVKIVYGGAAEQTEETNAFIAQAFAGAMFLIFFILLLEYNSFYQVFVTLSTVVMSISGVLLGMLVTGMSFSAIMTGLGIVALTGIVVKNGIVLIDTYNHYNRDDGVEPIKAMLITTAQRIRPVLLTAIVTALGVIPMAINIEFDFIRREIVMGGLAGIFFIHLASALVAGLLFSTLLTLVMVPVMVTAPSVFKGRFIRAWGWLRRAKKPDQGDDAPKKPKNEPLPIDGEFIQAE